MAVENITLGGVTIEELRRVKKAVQKDASAFVSKNMDEATAKLNAMLEMETVEEMTAVAGEIEQLLDDAATVAGIADITFYLPFHEDYCHNDDAFTSRLDSKLDELGVHYWEGPDILNDLYSTLENMESDSRDWHSSRC